MRPLTKNQLLNRLLCRPRGRIVLWNFVDGHAENLFGPGDVREFFLWWCAALPIVEAAPSPLTEHDPLFTTLELLRPEPGLWVKLDNTYPGLASLGKKPEFRALCCRTTHRRGANSTLLTTLDTGEFFTFLGADVKNDLLGTNALDTTSDGATVRAMIGRVPTRALADRLKDGAHLGPPGGVLWYTTSQSMDDFIRNRDADGACDCLGLAHIGQGTDMVAVEFDASALGTGHNGRPTAIDAGANRRFKIRADDSGHRHRSPWGHTADLAKLEKRLKMSDGVPERVCHPVACNSLGHVKVRPLGRTAPTRGNSRRVDDKGFADRLARGRDKKVLKRAMLELL